MSQPPTLFPKSPLGATPNSGNAQTSAGAAANPAEQRPRFGSTVPGAAPTMPAAKPATPTPASPFRSAMAGETSPQVAAEPAAEAAPANAVSAEAVADDAQAAKETAPSLPAEDNASAADEPDSEAAPTGNGRQNSDAPTMPHSRCRCPSCGAARAGSTSCGFAFLTNGTEPSPLLACTPALPTCAAMWPLAPYFLRFWHALQASVGPYGLRCLAGRWATP